MSDPHRQLVVPTLDKTVNEGVCSICGNGEANRTLLAREMMFGLRHEFWYVECARCGCVWRTTEPLQIDSYYPDDYYPETSSTTAHPSLRLLLQRQRARYCLSGDSRVGGILVAQYGRPRAPIFGRPDYYAWLKYCGVNFSSAILDVGCGLGTLLVRLRNDGFKNLTGVDPFIANSIAIERCVTIKKQTLEHTTGEFDLVMMHHTFEHVVDPLRTLANVARLLKRRRYAVIRVPVAGSYAHRQYGAHWAQLDAPRHTFLHTVTSMTMLAAGAGLTVEKISFDSDEFQFWASEQYMRDIPLKDDRSYGVNPSASLFSREQIDRYKEQAVELNRRGEGDSACFYLYRP